jgi:hypothetical protein
LAAIDVGEKVTVVPAGLPVAANVVTPLNPAKASYFIM